MRGHVLAGLLLVGNLLAACTPTDCHRLTEDELAYLEVTARIMEDVTAAVDECEAGRPCFGRFLLISEFIPRQAPEYFAPWHEAQLEMLSFYEAWAFALERGDDETARDLAERSLTHSEQARAEFDRLAATFCGVGAPTPLTPTIDACADFDAIAWARAQMLAFDDLYLTLDVSMGCSERGDWDCMLGTARVIRDNYMPDLEASASPCVGQAAELVQDVFSSWADVVVLGAAVRFYEANDDVRNTDLCAGEMEIELAAVESMTESTASVVDALLGGNEAISTQTEERAVATLAALPTPSAACPIPWP